PDAVAVRAEVREGWGVLVEGRLADGRPSHPGFVGHRPGGQAFLGNPQRLPGRRLSARRAYPRRNAPRGGAAGRRPGGGFSGPAGAFPRRDAPILSTTGRPGAGGIRPRSARQRARPDLII